MSWRRENKFFSKIRSNSNYKQSFPFLSHAKMPRIKDLCINSITSKTESRNLIL
ncbi:hypothetical protein AGR4B_Lc70155 [Agrobacterium tumefaciens str. CFBP 5621]|nr:hypothetical protein AGR4B_Lc70155 [Agrobacterium tumefaciens str. CFBP 5621]